MQDFNKMRLDFHRIFIFLRENRKTPVLETAWGNEWFNKIINSPDKEYEVFLDMNSDYHMKKMGADDFIE